MRPLRGDVDEVGRETRTNGHFLMALGGQSWKQGLLFMEESHVSDFSRLKNIT